MMKKYQVILPGLIILLIVIGILNRYQPIMIDKTIETSMYRMDQAQYELPLKITMKGKYYRHIFKEDFFEGQVTLDQYDFTKMWDTGPIHIDEEEDLLQYITFDENEFRDRRQGKLFEQQTLGEIWVNKQFNEFLILFWLTPSDPHEFICSYSQDTAIFTAYPSSNRDEAIALLKKLEAFRGFK